MTNNFSMLGNAIEVHRLSQEKAPGQLIDEVSLLFDSRRSLDGFVRFATSSGLMDNFNTVEDKMIRLDDREKPFWVRFEFLRFPKSNWRIEAMCITEGTAPLHSQHLEENGSGCVVHASWKCSDLKMYLLDCQTMRLSYPLRAEYQNSYGIFSYFIEEGFYFKPRVNLRD